MVECAALDEQLRGQDLRGEDEEETPPFLFAEALEHLDEVTFLSGEGRTRLEEFRHERAELRAEARRPVGEFLAEIIRRIGLLAELDATVDVGRAAATKRNLAAFLDEVHGFSPLEGELTVRAFLDYLDAVGDRMLPWLRDRPLSLVRAPDGVGGNGE